MFLRAHAYASIIAISGVHVLSLVGVGNTLLEYAVTDIVLHTIASRQVR